ncbi:MAG: universal stress protein [Caldilineaceae bacterium]|nr:universal stress protein [Caldilineaceae bacterium]
MMQKRKVLIPLDGSDFSRQIVDVVRDFFAPEDVMFVLFRSAPPPALSTDRMVEDYYVGSMAMTGSYGSYSRALEAGYDAGLEEQDARRKALQDDLRIEVDRLRELGYTVALEVRFGDPARRIIEFVNESDIDLVAMATHGRSGLGRLVMGSVAEQVLRGVGVPVLLTRPEAAPRPRPAPGELLAKSLGDDHDLDVAVVTDGSTHGDHAVAAAANLAQQIDIKLTVLVSAGERDGVTHAQQVMVATQEAVTSLADAPKMTPLVGYADEKVLQYVTEHPVDLLVTGAFHDRGAGSAAAIGPTVQRIVQHAPTSVLITKGEQTTFSRVLACAAVDDLVAVNVAAQFARALDAQLTLLHVVPSSAASYLAASRTAETMDLTQVLEQGTRLSSAAKEWLERLSFHGYGPEAVTIRAGNAPEVILDTAQRGGYNLVIVGSQSDPGHFLGSVANAVARFAAQSVLVVRTRVR